MRLIPKYTLCIAIVLMSLLSGCKRQTLKDPSLFYAYIPITMDWSESNIDVDYTQNVSIYFFPKDGSAPYLLISGDLNFAIAKVPINDYSILIFNDVVDNLQGITFEDTDSYSGFNLYANALDSGETMYYEPGESDYMAATHDRVASWSLDDFSVTEEMVQYTRSSDFSDYIEQTRTLVKSRMGDGSTMVSSLGIDYPSIAGVENSDSITRSLEDVSSVVMQPSTALSTINVVVKNLNNAAIIEGTLRGTASGVNLSTNSRLLTDDTTNSYNFDFTTLNYDADQTNGTAYHQLATFGKIDAEDAKYEFIVNIIISTGQRYTFVRDVTEQVNASDDFNIVITLDNLDTSADDGIIVLPDGVADGFGVTDWDGQTDVDLN